jgi:uncharacterized membrane protein
MIAMVSPAVLWPCVAGLAFLAAGLAYARRDFGAARGLERLVVLGPALYAAPLAVFGAEHLTSSRAIAQIVPKWMPGHLFWVYFVGLALLAGALSLVLRRYVGLSAGLLTAMFLVFVATIHLPNVLAHPMNRIRWAVMLRDTSFAAGALALVGTMLEEGRSTAGKGLIFASRILFAVPLLFFGFEHFLHPEYAPGVPLAKITPAWVPWRFFCADVVGAVLLVAGFSVLVNKWSRLAASTVGLAMVVLTLGLYLPILATTHGTAALIEGVNYVFDTLLFGGTALLVAGAMPVAEERAP